MRPKKETNKNEFESQTSKKPKRQKLPTECEICGHNCRFRYYNVQCCESCKQFFRRIVIKQKEFHCLKFWTCDFSKGERCRGCRLDKCLRLGMDPKLVNVPKCAQLDEFLGKLELRRRKLMDPHYTKFKIEQPEPSSIEQNARNSISPEGSEILENDFDQPEANESNSVSPHFSAEKMEMASISPLQKVKSANSSADPELAMNQQGNLLAWRSPSTLQTAILPHFDVLLKMEEKIRKIHFSCTELTPNYFDNFNGIGQLLLRMDNLMANAEQFSNQKAPHWIRPFVIESVQKQGIWARKPVYYIRDLLMVMDFARTIPIYNQLTLEDQITLVSSFSLSASRMIVCFYSLERNAQTMLLPNGMPIMEQFKVGRFANDPIFETMPKKVYDYPVSAFQKVAPSREEFVLLLTLLFLNSATSGLSTVGQQFLKEEAEKYGKALLHLQQCRLGEQAGALRYMETMSLLWNSNANAHKYRELLVYIDAVYEQGQFEKAMPKMLASLCLNGPRELPNLPGQF